MRGMWKKNTIQNINFVYDHPLCLEKCFNRQSVYQTFRIIKYVRCSWLRGPHNPIWIKLNLVTRLCSCTANFIKNMLSKVELFHDCGMDALTVRQRDNYIKGNMQSFIFCKRRIIVSNEFTGKSRKFWLKLT